MYKACVLIASFLCANLIDPSAIGPELNLNLQDIKLNTSPLIAPTLAEQQTAVAAETSLKFDPKSINQLLKIGRKIKLIDLDLTKYLKIICSHLKGRKQQADSETEEKMEDKMEDEVFESKAKTEQDLLEDTSVLDESIQKASFDWGTCHSNAHNLKSQYLERKFDELILKRFNLLPGFEDLFVFMPSQSHSGHVLDFEQLVQGERKLKSQRRPDSLDLSQQQIDKDLNDLSARSFDIADYSEFENSLDDSDEEKVYPNTSFDEGSGREENEEKEDADGSGYFVEKDR